MEKLFISSPIAHYDADKKLYGVYIGMSDKNRTLFATIWDALELRAIEKARLYADLLNRVDEEGNDKIKIKKTA